MALLVGRSDVGSFGGSGFFGFGDAAAANVDPGAFVSAGTATLLNTAITNFNGEAHIRCAVFERVGAAAIASLVTTVDVLSAASPQSTTIAGGVTITTGNSYYVFFYSPFSGSPFYNMAIDTSGAASDRLDGNGSAADGGVYSSISSTVNTPPRADLTNSEIYWNLDGTTGGGGGAEDQVKFNKRKRLLRYLVTQ